MSDMWFDSTVSSLNVRYSDTYIRKEFHRRDYICATCKEIVFVTHSVYSYADQLYEAVTDHVCEALQKIPRIRMIRV